MLQFDIEGDSFDTITIDIPVAIQPKQSSLQSNNNLEIENIDVTMVGKLTFKFNKNIKTNGIKRELSADGELINGITFPVSKFMECEV